MNRRVAAVEHEGDRDVGVFRDDGDRPTHFLEIALFVGIRLQILAEQIGDHAGESVLIGPGRKRNERHGASPSRNAHRRAAVT